MARLILFNKPYKVLSQFTDAASNNNSDSHQGMRQTLADFIPIDSVYPAGRLDYDSEGLLLLTDDGALQNQISHPKHKLNKTYWVQVEGAEDPAAVEQLRQGVILKDGPTQKAQVSVITKPKLWSRQPPVRFRQSIPTHWLQITISEGRNRQVRRMTAAVGLPTLRLIRCAIGNWQLGSLQPGEWQQQTLHMPKINGSDKHRSKKVVRRKKR